MKNKLIYLLTFVLSVLSCKTDTKNKKEDLKNSKVSQIDSLANRYLELGRFGGTIVIAKEGVITYNKSFGLADYENNVSFTDTTAFKVGEITELVTANIINELVKQEKIQLTNRVSSYLLDIESNSTISDILNNKSQEEHKLDYNTLGVLIEKVSGKSYQLNVEEYSKNLELENTYYQKQETSKAIGYLFYNYQGKGLELQKSPSYNLEEAFSSRGVKSTGKDLVKIINSNPKDLDIHGYLQNDGFSYSLINDIENKITMVILSNRRHPIGKEMSTSIGAILKNIKYRLPLSRKPFNINKNKLKEFTGSFSINEQMSFEIIAINDSLFVMLGPNKVHLIPQSENQFYMINNDASMRFEKDSTDIVNKVILLNGFIESDQEATRIK